MVRVLFSRAEGGLHGWRWQRGICRDVQSLLPAARETMCRAWDLMQRARWLRAIRLADVGLFEFAGACSSASAVPTTQPSAISGGGALLGFARSGCASPNLVLLVTLVVEMHSPTACSPAPRRAYYCIHLVGQQARQASASAGTCISSLRALTFIARAEGKGAKDAGGG